MRKCPFCGNECKEDAKICLGCGAALQTDDYGIDDINRLFAASGKPHTPPHNPARPEGEYPQQAQPYQSLRFDDEPENRRAAATRAIQAQAAVGSTQRLDDLYADEYTPRHAVRRRPRGFQLTPPMIIVCVVLAVVLFIGIFVAVLNHKYSIGTFTNTFVKAVSTQNVDTLNSLVQGKQKPTDAQWQAFCAAFDTQEQLDALRAHIEKLSTNKNATGTFPAIGLTSTSAWGLLREYHFTVQGVSVQVASVAKDVALTLNGEAVSGGLANGNTITFNDVFPGKYSYTVSGTSAGAPLSESGEGLLLMDPAVPGNVSLAVPTVDVSITNCIAPSALLYVDNAARSEKPQEDGTVVLTGVIPGSEIMITYTDAVGSSYKSSITVQSGVAQYSFAEYTVDRTLTTLASAAAAASVTAAVDASGLNALTAVYFSSYLECINNQNMLVIQYVTDAQKTRLASRIGTASNKAYMYTFTTAAVNSSSIIVDANATLTCNVQFDYTYYTRGGDAIKVTQNTTYQTLVMTYTNGIWAVNDMQSINADQYANNEYASMG